MKSIINYIPVLFLALFLMAGCKKDPYDGVTSNEKSIEAYTLGGGLVQVGPAVIDRTAGTVQVRVLMQANTDLSKVAGNVISSYKSTVEPVSGSTVNFKAGNNKSTYTVTAESGESRQWTVELIPFTETLIGSYSIQNLTVFGGTGPEYGGGSVFKLSDKGGWPVSAEPSTELDNKLTFTFTGVTADGSTYGDIVNDAGADGKYANFLYSAKNSIFDVNKFYRAIPTGTGKWERNYTANTITFTFADGKKVVGTFLGAGTESLGNGNNKTITDNSFAFTLSSADDWGNIYSDYDKIVSRPRKFWIDVKKQ
ncbi:hypothetical protein GS399_06240 [Pedobacter sp. HMF7647]|uniref:Uncharacterized protein n=1 Tax=Hufsiella arboris TaxID=2695275 RepID=A0A7K1Y7L8_9SPHI|nr:hypothetical protein [Hufsiella arboris]MXV50567.1 hypothetical protein [Hufsiella arboris]